MPIEVECDGHALEALVTIFSRFNSTSHLDAKLDTLKKADPCHLVLGVNWTKPPSGLGIEGCHGYDLTMHAEQAKREQAGFYGLVPSLLMFSLQSGHFRASLYSQLRISERTSQLTPFIRPSRAPRQIPWKVLLYTLI